MEWNQPAGKEAAVKKPVYLIGEIIRIGAVMLDEDMHEVSRHYSCVVPKFYKHMNESVGRLTGLKSSAITYGMSFPNAFSHFMKWCGTDCVFLTWGGEDEKVMRANMGAYQIKGVRLPKFYDLQKIFAYRVVCDGRQYGLTAALEHYGLTAELQAHNALNDAIYAARIGIAMDLSGYLSEYDKMLEEIRRIKSEIYIVNSRETGSRESIIENSDICVCRCPVCDTEMKREEYIFHKETSAISCAECGEHGAYYIKIRFKECTDGTVSVTRRIKRLTAAYREYYDRKTEESKLPEVGL